MRIIYVLLLTCFSFNISGQSKISVEFIQKTGLNADQFIGVDEFEAVYFIRNNTLIKETEDNIYNYQNTLLGEISSVDIINPLKILIFYKAHSTVVLLDKSLNELSNPINFTALGLAQNIGLANMAQKNQLWLYSPDDNRLHLWDLQTNKINHSSKPLSFLKRADFNPNQQITRYDMSYLSTGDGLLKFNEYAQFESSLIFNDFSDIILHGDDFIFLKSRLLYYQSVTDSPKDLILNPRVNVKNFYSLNNHLYIFDGATLFTFKIAKI